MKKEGMSMNAVKLTKSELTTLKALAKNAMETTAGAFGCMDDAAVGSLKDQQGAQAFGALVSNLQKKDLVEVHGARRVNDFTVQQYTLSERGWTRAGYDASEIG